TLVLELPVSAAGASSASSAGSRAAISFTTVFKFVMYSVFSAHQPEQTFFSALSPRLHHQRPRAPSTMAIQAWLRISARVGKRPCEVNLKNCRTVMIGRESLTALRLVAVQSATCRWL